MLNLEEINELEEIEELNFNHDSSNLVYTFVSPYKLSTKKPVFTQQDINNLRCPINHTIMNDPVMLISVHQGSNGQEDAMSHTYEREAITSCMIALDTQESIQLPTTLDSNTITTTTNKQDIKRMLVIPDTNKKLVILEFLEQEQYAKYRDEVPLPKLWQDNLCNLICSKTSQPLNEQIYKIGCCLRQDKRLLTVPLHYAVNDKELFNFFDHSGVQTSFISTYSDYHSDSMSDYYNWGDNVEQLLKPNPNSSFEEDSLQNVLTEFIAINQDDYSSSDYSISSQKCSKIRHVNCSALLLAGLFASTEIAQFLLQELKKTNSVDLVIEEKYSLQYANQKPLCFPYADKALKETLDLNENNKEDFILWLKLGAQINGLMHELSSVGNPNIEWLLRDLDGLAEDLQINNPWGTTAHLLATQNSNGDTPLHVAIQNQHLTNVTLLLNYGANANTQNNVGDTPLHLAVKNNNYDLVKILCDFGATKSILIKNNLEKTPIYVASTENKNKILQLLVNPGFSNTLPLHLAIQYSDLDLLQFWLDKGSQLEIKGHQQQTPLYFAVSHATQTNHIKDIFILCDKGASLAVCAGKLQQTIFHILAHIDNYLLSQILLPFLLHSLTTSTSKIKSVLNIRDVDGNTALHIAAHTGNINVVQLLLRNGASYSIPNGAGQIPNDIADRRNARQINQEIILAAKQHSPQNLMLYNYDTQCSSTQQLTQNFAPFNKVLLNGNLVIFSDIVQIIDPNGDRDGIYLHNHNLSPHCIISLSNGSLASVSNECDIYIWSIQPSKIYGIDKRLVTVLKGHLSNITSIQELPNNSLASIDINGTIKIWDLNTQSNLYSIEQEDASIQCFALHSTATEQNLLCGAENIIHIWQLYNLSSNNAHSYKIGIPNNYTIQCLKIIHNNLLAVGLSNGSMQIFDLERDLTKSVDYQHFNAAIYCITSYNIDQNTIAIISGYENGAIIITKLSLATEKLELEYLTELQDNQEQNFHLFDCDTKNIVIVTKTQQSYVTQHANFQELISQLAVEKQNQSSSCNVM